LTSKNNLSISIVSSLKDVAELNQKLSNRRQTDSTGIVVIRNTEPEIKLLLGNENGNKNFQDFKRFHSRNEANLDELGGILERSTVLQELKTTQIDDAIGLRKYFDTLVIQNNYLNELFQKLQLTHLLKPDLLSWIKSNPGLSTVFHRELEGGTMDVVDPN